MVLYRQHRGSLDDSMATVVEVADRAELEMRLAEEMRPWIADRDRMYWGDLRIEPYAFDERIGWDTWLVSLPGYGVFGMLNGPL